MRKNHSAAFLALLFVALTAATAWCQVSAEGGFRHPVRMIHGTMMIPLRDAGEWMGAMVEWRHGTIHIVRNDRVVTVKSRSKTATVDGETFKLPEAIQVIDDTAYMPSREILEALGATVVYDAETECVTISFSDRTKRLDLGIARKQREVERALARIVPGQVDYTVQISGTVEEKRLDVTIEAHLLRGADPDDARPYVRGRYTTKKALTTLVKRRIASIFRAVFKTLSPADIEAVLVKCRHGVRETIIGAGPSHDVARTLYAARIGHERGRNIDWSHVSNEDIQNEWDEVTNILPDITIMPQF